MEGDKESVPESEDQPEGSKDAESRVAELEMEVQMLHAQLAQIPRNQETAFDRQAHIQKKRRHQLERERQRRIRCILGAAQQVDLLFLVDCTASMAPYIREIKKTIKNIVSGTKRSYEKLRVRLSFVGYRDFCDGDDRLTVFPFSSDISAFTDHVAEVEARGGGDPPEDVFGGIEEAMNQDWSEPNRIMVHIADAPCHGYRFHGRCIGEECPLDARGMDRRGISAEMVLSKVHERNVKYWFHHVDEKATSVMIAEFNKIAKDVGYVILTKDLDEDVALLAKHVMSSLAESITSTAAMISRTGTSTPLHLPRPKLAVFRPSWGRIKEESALELYTLPPDSISEISQNKDMSQKQNKITLKLAPLPFARGSLRDAHYGIEIIKGKDPADVVMKRFDSNRKGSQSMVNYELQMEVQCIAGFLAKEFNKAKESLGLQCMNIKFLEVRTVLMIDRQEPFYANIEAFIKGFEKYNSNAGYVVAEMHDEVQAFSHWTYQTSGGYLMVVDLQGMITDEGYCLTDPAIHSKDCLRFGATNLGSEGFKCFFKTHTCNDICTSLKLQPIDPDYLDI